MRDKYLHGWDGPPVNHPAMLNWVPGLSRATGTLQSPVEGFHKTVEPGLRKLLYGWELEVLTWVKLIPGQSVLQKNVRSIAKNM